MILARAWKTGRAPPQIFRHKTSLPVPSERNVVFLEKIGMSHKNSIPFHLVYCVITASIQDSNNAKNQTQIIWHLTLMEDAKAKMDQEKEQNKEARREIGELVSWAEAFDDAEPETRRMIIARLVERIDIGADYSISIRFQISMKQYTGDVA